MSKTCTIPGWFSRAIALASRWKVPFCLILAGQTTYGQGKVKDVPSGFDSPTGNYRVPRLDAARIRILVDLSPQNPVEGQDFILKASLENGGDVDFAVDRVEESLPTGAEAFGIVKSVTAPKSIPVGQTELIYTYRASMAGRSTYRKVLRIVDKKGDSWTREIQIRPCGD